MLKNNQEREVAAETPVIHTALAEAMLIACVNTTPNDSSKPTRPHLLVCEIPADKNRSGTPSKVPKSSEGKGKSKSVSYSTQLSFESEDEYYDPLFSVPSVFQSIPGPFKNGFPKFGAEKADETQTVKNAKIVQCLSIKELASECVKVSQVIPYEDGSHVLFVLTKGKQNCFEKPGVSVQSPDENDALKMNGDNCQRKELSEENCELNESGLVIQASPAGRDFSATTKEPNGNTADRGSTEIKNCSNHNELREDNLPSASSDSTRPHSKPSNSDTKTFDNTEYIDGTREECSIAELQSPNNVKYPEEICDVTGPAGAELENSVMSNVNIKNNEGNCTVGSNTLDNTNYLEMAKSSVSNADTSLQSTAETLNSESRDSGSSHELNSKVSHKVETIADSCENKLFPSNVDKYERKYLVSLLLYKTRKEKGRTLLEDHPCKSVITTSKEDCLCDVFLLPDDAEDSFMPSSAEANDYSNVYLAG